jgi:hypothetical protein
MPDLDDTEHSIDISALVFPASAMPLMEASYCQSSMVSSFDRKDYDDFDDEDGECDEHQRCYQQRQGQSQASSPSFPNRKLLEHNSSSGSLMGSISSRMCMNVSFSDHLEIVHTIPTYHNDMKARCFYSGAELDDFRVEYEFEREGLFPNGSTAES